MMQERREWSNIKKSLLISNVLLINDIAFFNLFFIAALHWNFPSHFRQISNTYIYFILSTESVHSYKKQTFWYR